MKDVKRDEGLFFYIILAVISIFFFGKKEVVIMSRKLKEHKRKIFIFFTILITLTIYFYGINIMNFFTIEVPKIVFETIPNFFVNLFHGIKKNWFKIGLSLFAYKFILMVLSNLGKRFIINKSVDRFKKSLIFSEMDELIEISSRVFLENLSNKTKKLKQIPYVGILFTFILKIFSFATFLIVLVISLFKFGLGKLLLTKVLSAQFWTGMLVFVSNIPGFFVITGLFIWLWFEAHIPWIPRFYYWLSMKFRIFLDPIWDNVVIPLAEKTAFIVDYLRINVFEPIGNWFDIQELKVINSLKRYIFFQRGKDVYIKYMKLVVKHNKDQLQKKEEKEKQIRVKQFSVMRRRVKTLKEMRKKKEEKEEN